MWEGGRLAALAGGLVAAAPEVEPQDQPVGEHTSTEQSGTRCGNCDTMLMGKYCHACGQRRLVDGVPVRDLLSEAGSEFLGLESRLASTLRLLAINPGGLTMAYLEGRRVRYVAPIRLYMLASVAFGAALVFADDTVIVSLEGAAPDRTVWLRYWLSSVIVMMPAFAGLVRLVTGRGCGFGGHLVFAMHLHSAAFLAVAIVLPIVEVNWAPAVSAALLLATPLGLGIYLVAALRSVFSVGALRAVLSAAGIGLSYLALQLGALVASGYVLSALTGALGPAF